MAMHFLKPKKMTTIYRGYVKDISVASELISVSLAFESVEGRSPLLQDTATVLTS